jgi:glycosyltransferase involved in cell wall biosynthesis
LNLGVEWLKPEQIELLSAPAASGLHRLWQLDMLYARTLERINQQNYDFIYGQGTMGTLGVIAARRRHIPCGQRLYGISYFIREFTDGLLDWVQQARAFIRHPLHYKAFSLPKDFLLVTNDGTRADHVFNRIGDPHTKFLFWHNGVDYPRDAGQQPDSQDVAPFLLYPGRIDRFKRQHLAIELLRRLAGDGQPPVRLKLAGHDYDAGYRQELNELVAKRGLAEHVDFLGPLAFDELQLLYRSCLAVLSFYEVSNLGNVAIEALAHGAPLISLDDGTLSHIIDDGTSGFLAADLGAAATAVESLLRDPALRSRVSASARQAAVQHFSPWEERVTREIEQIELVARRRGSARP